MKKKKKKGGEINILNLKFKILKWIFLGALFLSLAMPVFGLTPKSSPTPLPTSTPTPAKVDYFLAYPGFLPGHFLYPITAFFNY